MFWLGLGSKAKGSEKIVFWLKTPASVATNTAGNVFCGTKPDWTLSP